MTIAIHHIVSTIKQKFYAEGLSEFFTIKPYSFSAPIGLLDLGHKSCILLEFPTPCEEFPDFYQSSVYRLLIIFNLHQETQFPPPLQTSLKRLQDKDNIDRIAIWSTVEIDQYTLQMLKGAHADIVSVSIPAETEIFSSKPIAHFVPIENSDLTYSLLVNLTAERLIKRFKKMFHLILSEVAAPIYNTYYKKSKIATNSFMEFEEKKLFEIIKTLKCQKATDLAIDVGCGTGRHSFILAQHFKEVYAYDFSPGMVREANNRKRSEDIRNILFEVNDFEYEKFLDEAEFTGKCDLIVASFGMGSFIEETPEMLRRFYTWLKPNGYIFLSFYNAHSITLNVTPSWSDASLTAQVDKDNHSLEVTLTPKTRFSVFCKLFDEGTKGEINKIFNIDEIATYPTIMALLPNGLLENEIAKEFFERVDELIANDQDTHFAQRGYYVTVIAHKTQETTHSFRNIVQRLEQMQADYHILEHEPVLSIEDVRKVDEISHALGTNLGCLIKTIILKNVKTDEFIAIAVQAGKKLNKTKLATLFNVSTHRLKFATEKDVLAIGFPVGGVAPFGFEEGIELLTFIDNAIATEACEWLYMGIGDNQKTLKIKKGDFLALTADYQPIELS